jgi:hypothetical protein
MKRVLLQLATTVLVFGGMSLGGVGFAATSHASNGS